MKILHLYYDLMNLYGEYGNVSAVKRILENSGQECQVDRLTVNDEVNFDEYDFVYIGSGTEKNQKAALNDFKKYDRQIKNYIGSNKLILMTGNSFEMLGKAITDCKGEMHMGLGVFDFVTTEQNNKRITSDAIFTTEFQENVLVGFINKCSEINGIDSPLFTVKMGVGNNNNDNGEGFHLANLFATHLTGPILIKNPYFLEFIAKRLSENTNGFEVKADYLKYERLAYEVTVSKLNNRLMNNEK